MRSFLKKIFRNDLPYSGSMIESFMIIIYCDPFLPCINAMQWCYAAMQRCHATLLGAGAMQRCMAPVLGAGAWRPPRPQMPSRPDHA
jgi:hypothetical protein